MLLDPAMLAAYVVAATALALSPGPDTMFVLASGTSGGPRSGVAAAFGIAAGATVHALLAALGISALIAASPAAFDILRFAGALYLLWIGIKALRACLAGLRAPQPAPYASSAETALSTAFRRGFTTNVFNPKVGIFYVSFLPQFANPDLGHLSLQIFLLGVIHNFIATAWLVGLSMVSGRTAQVFARNARVRAWLHGAAANSP